MLSRMFRAHGELCASRPWEVIIGTVTLTMCMMSMSLFASSNKICGWNYVCVDREDDVLSSDVIILTITRCLAVVYIYLQFRNLRKLGSKYLLGIAAVFTIFSSFVFSIAVVNMVGGDLTGLNEALPFFLLLVDLAKTAALARFALSSDSQDDVVDNIGKGMALIGPTITLDAIVESLVIGVGTLSGVPRLETMCCFGCLSVLANYLAFMTFYPACLALVLELLRGRNQGRPMWQIQQFTKVLQDEEQKSNPVTQRVKIIMSAGLVMVHVHSRLVRGDVGLTILDKTGAPALTHSHIPDIPFWLFVLQKAASVDYTLTLFLGIVLAVKYVMFDSDIEIDRNMKESQAFDKQEALKEKSLAESPIACAESKPQQNGEFQHHCDKDGSLSHSNKPCFMLGEGDSDDSEEENHDVQKKLLSAITGDKVTTGTQTERKERTGDDHTSHTLRPVEECLAIYKSDVGPAGLSDEEIIELVNNKHIPAYKLQTALFDHIRGVHIRRRIVTRSLMDQESLSMLPYDNYDYEYVEGACCENVIGYMPVPVGVAGPMLLDGEKLMVPLATTEGCLVASTNRGCRALSLSGGVKSMTIGNNMTRAPVVRFPTAQKASIVKLWLEESENFDMVAEAFNSTSRFARLKKILVVQFARNLYIRFVAVTGDAMGMNMLSKGSEKALNILQEEHFPDMEIISLSGNFCTDKKPSAINWLEGRGKSVVSEAIIPSHVVQNMLKTSVPALVDLNLNKNLMGSAAAGSIGGFNAHAANIVAAIYIACGQDPAQTVCSSNCMTVMEPAGPNHEDLFISCTMPSIEVGTVGGGTILPPQAACLQMLGVKGASKDEPGTNACKLARIVCATVLAAELSLMSALAAGHLVKSHLKHNRSVLNMASGSSSNPTHGSSASTPNLPRKEPGTCVQKAS